MYISYSNILYRNRGKAKAQSLNYILAYIGPSRKKPIYDNNRPFIQLLLDICLV